MSSLIGHSILPRSLSAEENGVVLRQARFAPLPGSASPTGTPASSRKAGVRVGRTSSSNCVEDGATK
eukprot:3748891-Prorocentrum_lima.AAC.1